MSKKVATIILTIIFMCAFIFIGVGSCGGIKYLIDNNQGSVATVYADEIGGGVVNTKTEYISVALNKYSFLIDGYRGNGFPSVYWGAEFIPVGDLRFVAVYNNDSLFAFYVTTLQLTGYYEAGSYHTEDLNYINTDLTSTNLVNIAFLNLFQGSVEPGCLEFASQRSIDLRTCGKFIAADVDLIGGDTSVGRFNLSLIFENDTYEYVVSPYGWREFGDYVINKIYNYFSYKEIYSLGNTNVAIDTNYYFEKGYKAAYDEYYQSRYDQGYGHGEQFGRDEGYAAGILDANDYTFFSLISSVIDIPVKAFIGLTDFDFLGFNMSTFYKAVLGFALIVIVLRVVIP